MNNETFLKIIANADYSEIVHYIRDNRENLSDIVNLILDKLPNILDNLLDIEANYEINVSLPETLEIVSEFLEYVNIEHKNKFNELLNDGTFTFVDVEDDDNEFEDKDAYFKPILLSEVIDGYDEEDIEYEDGIIHYTINIPIYHTIFDVFTIVHEYFHYDNYHYYQSADRYSLTEAISISFEFLLYDYLIKIGIDKNVVLSSINARFENVILMSEGLMEFLDKLEEYEYETDNFDLTDIDIDGSSETYLNINQVEKFFKYFFGGVLGLLVYYKYKNEQIDISNVDNWSKYINNYDFYGSLEYLFDKFPCANNVETYLDFFVNDVIRMENQKKIIFMIIFLFGYFFF